jgi:hypothetical protein
VTSDKSGRLLVVGTPIGNLEDLSPRAQRALSEADAILCEDTRVTAKLAHRFGLAAARISCPAPREKSRSAELLRRLSEGQTVALVTDAGMPALSDPASTSFSSRAGRVSRPRRPRPLRARSRPCSLRPAADPPHVSGLPAGSLGRKEEVPRGSP